MASPENTELWRIKNAPYYCLDGHREAEMVSTNQMKWMCKEHTPVWLSESINKPVFQEYHIEVSTIFLKKIVFN